MLAASGALGAGGLSGLMSRALARGTMPTPSSIYKLEGTATVNGQGAKAGTRVQAGDKVATGPASTAVVVVGQDAFLLRENTTIETRGDEPEVLRTLLVEAGRVLSVFGKKPMSIRTPIATIGIRGTGAYIEAVDPKEVYFCLCYGGAVVEGIGLTSPRGIRTTHHEEPILCRLDGPIMTIEAAKFRNHTDEELVMLEALVGREPPFTKGAQYPAKKY